MKVVLHTEWADDAAVSPPIRRRIDGFEDIKKRIAGGREEVLHLHAFTYAFLRKAKNVDLYVEADDRKIETWLTDLRKSLVALEAFEREGSELPESHTSLKPIYLALRRVFARPGARDERRAMVHLLMNGPCTDAGLAEGLGLSVNLAVRVRKALQPALKPKEGSDAYWISKTALPVVVFLVRETTGIDPLSALDDHVAA